MRYALTDQLRNRIAVLVNLIREDEATQKDLDELEQLVLRSPEACRLYNDLVYLECELKWTHEKNLEPSSALTGDVTVDLPELIYDLNDIDPDAAWGLTTPNTVTTTSENTGVPILGFLTNSLKNGGGSIVWGILGLVMMLPIALLFFVMNDSTVETLPVVAKVIRQTEGTQWKGRLTSLAGSELLLGQRLRCQNGAVELQMNSGTVVLLEGNTSFLLTGPNTIYLERGSLVAKVPHDASGFAVQTSDADFIDIGTEFGVNVDPGKMSRTKVLDGQIVVQTEDANGKKNRVHFSSNEAAQVTPDGQIESISPSSISFTSIYPEDRVCLFNLICHSSSYYPDGIWIDPRDGDIKLPTEKGWFLNKPGDPHPNEAGFHAASHIPVIDGVFVPTPGKSVVVNSNGDQFGKIKNGSSDSHCCFAIGKAENIGVWNIPQDYKDILTGVSDSQNPSSSANHVFMNIHANLGVTFDLEAVNRYTGRKALQFVATARKGEDIVYEKPSELDLLILADDKLIYENRGVKAQDGIFSVRLDIPEGTRFLTVISADGNDGSESHAANVCDHLILDDPAFVLEGKKGQ